MNPSAGPVIAHWHQLLEGLRGSSLEFYTAVEQAIARRSVPDVKNSRIDYREGGLLSAKREYLRIKRRNLIFDICAAPFGSGFFVSWWLGERNWRARLVEIPVLGLFVGWLLRPFTYFKMDTALMFQEMVHQAVLEVVDGLTQAKGLRGLSELERKPILRDFSRR